MALAHSEEFKRDAVRIALTSGLTCRQASSMIEAGTTSADVVDFFMALLSFRWNQHPEPTDSRRATPTSHFQQ